MTPQQHKIALDLAVGAYDEARCRLNGEHCQPMSEANANSIRPMIAQAIAVYIEAVDRMENGAVDEVCSRCGNSPDSEIHRFGCVSIEQRKAKL